MKYLTKKNLPKNESIGKFLIVRFLWLFLPKLNPDYFRLDGRVSLWVLEVDQGEVVREVGIDENGVAVLGAPLGENEGIYTGQIGIDGEECVDWDFERFDALWKEMQKKYD